MIKADFLIVGTMKSGTSTLSSILNQHPKVNIPKNELHFFNRDINYNKGENFYNKNFITGFLNGEKTPTYSYQPNCAERIYKYNSKIKLIWILRNPVDRAISNYYHAFKNGKENKSLIDCFMLEEKRVKQNIFKGYFVRSLYSKQVERFLKYFPKSQMYFAIFEEMIHNYDEEINKINNFLHIDKFSFELEHKNKTKQNIFRKIYDLIINNKKIKNKIKIDLKFYYNEEINILEKLINKDLKIWRN